MPFLAPGRKDHVGRKLNAEHIVTLSTRSHQGANQTAPTRRLKSAFDGKITSTPPDALCWSDAFGRVLQHSAACAADSLSMYSGREI
jgi:hypothetical protein